MKEIENLDTKKLREDIIEFFPDALQAAMASYRRFMETEKTGTIKDFADHHNAAKIAMTHIKLLMELADRAELPGSETGDLAELIRQANAEMDAYRERTGDE